MDLPTILLAEDNLNDRDLALAAFAESGLANEIVWLEDGQRVLDYLNKDGDFKNRDEKRHAVLLLDLKMPKVDGVQVLRSLKRDPAHRTLPVVMLTSSREEKDLAQCYDLGVNAYVVKPVGFTDFVAALKEVGVFWAVLNQIPHAASAPPGIA